jgi:hypothetical protein
MRIIENGQICSEQVRTFLNWAHPAILPSMSSFPSSVQTSMPAAWTRANLDVSKIEQTSVLTTGDDGQRLIVFTIVLWQAAQVAPFFRSNATLLQAPALDKSRGFFSNRLTCCL